MFTAFIQEVNLKKVNKTALGVSKLIRTVSNKTEIGYICHGGGKSVCVGGKQKLLMERLGEGEEENNR